MHVSEVFSALLSPQLVSPMAIEGLNQWDELMKVDSAGVEPSSMGLVNQALMEFEAFDPSQMGFGNQALEEAMDGDLSQFVELSPVGDIEAIKSVGAPEGFLEEFLAREADFDSFGQLAEVEAETKTPGAEETQIDLNDLSDLTGILGDLSGITGLDEFAKVGEDFSEAPETQEFEEWLSNFYPVISNPVAIEPQAPFIEPSASYIDPAAFIDQNFTYESPCSQPMGIDSDLSSQGTNHSPSGKARKTTPETSPEMPNGKFVSYKVHKPDYKKQSKSAMFMKNKVQSGCQVKQIVPQTQVAQTQAIPQMQAMQAITSGGFFVPQNPAFSQPNQPHPVVCQNLSQNFSCVVTSSTSTKYNGRISCCSSHGTHRFDSEKRYTPISVELKKSKKARPSSIKTKPSGQAPDTYDSSCYTTTVERVLPSNFAKNEAQPEVLSYIASKVVQQDTNNTVPCVYIKRVRYSRDVNQFVNNNNVENLVYQVENFTTRYPYNPQIVRFFVHGDKQISETRDGLCPYCPGIQFYNIKTSAYAQHLAFAHGISTQNLLTPVPLYPNIYMLSKSEVKAQPRTRVAHAHPRPGVVCPCCYQIIEAGCSISTKSHRPLTNYLRHFKEHHYGLNKSTLGLTFEPDNLEGLLV